MGNPQRLSGGAFFSKLILNEDETLIFQTPKCCSKNGIVSTSKKIYCDLLFQDNNSEFIQWLDHLETAIKYLIYDKRDLWFHNEMEFEDIEYFFNPSIRVYKRNKYLLRCHVRQPKHIKKNYTLQIYDENETDLEISDIKVEQKIISILEILGIKYSNTSFHIEYCLRQIMLLDEKPIFNKCLIQPNKYNKLHNILNITDQKIELNKPIVNTKSTTNTADEHNEHTTNETIEHTAEPIEVADEIIEPADETIDPADEIIEHTDETVEHAAEPIEHMAQTDEHTNETIEAANKTLEAVNKQTECENETLDVNTVDNEEKTETLEKVLPKFRDSLQHLEENVEEIDLNKMNIADESIKIKERKEVYYELYKQAKKKAIEAKQNALQSFLELKRIKNTYLITEIDESEDIFTDIQKIKI